MESYQLWIQRGCYICNCGYIVFYESRTVLVENKISFSSECKPMFVSYTVS